MNNRIVFTLKFSIVLFFLLGGKAFSAGFDVAIEIPKLSVAEYHAPYVSIWLDGEETKGSYNKTLAVWYDLKKRNDEGQKWLKDLRQWWRKGGRDLNLPVDGVSGATRLPGVHKMHFELGKEPLGVLPEGTYVLNIEMAREAGGREVVKIPFTWSKNNTENKVITGNTEIGVVNLTLVP